MGENLSKNDLYTWEPHLQIIPPQAVQCCFADPSKCLKSMETLNPEEMDKFKTVMKRASPMQMIVHRRHAPTDIWNSEFYSTDPDLTVSLVSKDKKDVLGKLRKSFTTDINIISEKTSEISEVLRDSTVSENTKSHPTSSYSLVHPDLGGGAVNKVRTWLNSTSPDRVQELRKPNIGVNIDYSCEPTHGVSKFKVRLQLI